MQNFFFYSQKIDKFEQLPLNIEIVMPLISDAAKHGEKITDLAEHYTIKNYVLKEGAQMIEGQLLDTNHVFDGFMLIICLKGEAVLKVNYKEYRFREGEIFNYLPGQIISIKEYSADFVMEALLLSADFVVTLPLPKDFDLLKRIAAAPLKKVDPEML